jgi:hypothetical protein
MYSGFIILINAKDILNKTKLGFRLMQEYCKLVIQDKIFQYNTLSSHNYIMNVMTKRGSSSNTNSFKYCSPPLIHLGYSLVYKELCVRIIIL